MSENSKGILIIIGILAISLFGGVRGAGNNGLFSNGNATPEQKQANIQQNVQQTQAQVDALKAKIKVLQDKKLQSVYYGVVNLSYVNRGANPNQEYLSIYVNGNTGTSIPITGWTLHSTESGETVTIPQGTYLYFKGADKSSEENIYAKPGDTLYIITGISPIVVSFKLNKCSGYLGQFQTFTPYVGSTCPAPRDEDLSVIPKITVNDACLDYINSFPSCRAQIDNLPIDWSYECKHFIETKLNYSSCVDNHKSDRDFYQNEWRIYLKRNSKLWKDSHENIILYDNLGKIVSTLTY